MLKNTDKYEDTSAHFSYNEYKKKVKKSPNRDVMIFSAVFIAGVIIILGFARILSPNVDVGITVDNEVSNLVDEEQQGSSIIDDRLRRLKLEDEGKQEGDEEMFSPELDERVVLPTQKKKTVGEMEAEKSESQKETTALEHKTPETKEVSKSVKAEADVKPTSTLAPKPQAPMPEQIVNAKVVVGYYATEKQAEVAKSIIQDAGLGVTPLVKNLGGYYTLQVGSYSSREKAQQAANGLLKSNFPARVIVE